MFANRAKIYCERANNARKYAILKVSNLVEDDVVQSFVEEVVGNFSSSSVIAFFSLTGGGLLLLADPVTGTIIVVISIAYGSFLKVYSGKYYRRRFKKKRQETTKNLTSDRLENGVMKLFKKWATSTSMKYLRTESATYGFVRLTSKLTSRRKKVVPYPR